MSFKKTVVAWSLAAVAAVFSIDASAMVNFGIKGGVGASFDRVEGMGGGYAGKMGLGYAGGASVGFGLGPVGLLVDALYLANETKFGVDDDNYISMKTKSLHIPVQVSFSLMPMLSITGGMYYNMALGQIAQTTVTAGSESNSDLDYEDADAKKSSYGIVGGLAMGLPLGVTKLSLELRATYGLSNLSETSGVTIKNFGAMFLAGVVF